MIDFIIAMRGYPCANENEICNCSGKVTYGIYYTDDNDQLRITGMHFGNLSEKKYVEKSINCTKENFEDYAEVEFEEYLKRCRCYPSSNLFFIETKNIFAHFFF